MRKFIALAAFILPFYAFGCTGIVHKAENGDAVYARTMEFGVDVLTFNLLFVPKGIEYTSQIDKDTEGAKWTTKYAHVGFNPAKNPILIDGINEKGLAAGGFYFPGWTEYEPIEKDQLKNTIGNIDFISWVLGNFATVSEVREALKEVKVAGALFPEWGVVPPIHYIVVDESGDRIVIEYVKGKQNIYNAYLSTVTNAPTYDWHETNARNYIGLSALNEPSITINGHDLSQFGQGSGALGLPGDFTPPSRFIRAGFLNEVVLSGKNGTEEVDRAFKILNQFDIPRGAVRSKDHIEETQWTSASDLKNRKYYFHTYTDRSIKAVDLKKLGGSSVRMIPITEKEKVIDVTSSFN